MADVVRILGLDDDNHAPMFITEDGDIFSTPRELIKWLSHAHDPPPSVVPLPQRGRSWRRGGFASPINPNLNP